MEERMIRVSWDNYYTLTHGDDGGIAETVLSILENIEWEDLEIAPPKDWNPRCFGRCYKFPSECQRCTKQTECIKEHDRLRVIANQGGK